MPAAGHVRLLGEPLRPGHYPRKRVGVVLQREFAPDYLSVGEYAELMAALYGVPAGGGDDPARKPSSLTAPASK